MHVIYGITIIFEKKNAVDERMTKINQIKYIKKNDVSRTLVIFSSFKDVSLRV